MIPWLPDIVKPMVGPEHAVCISQCLLVSLLKITEEQDMIASPMVVFGGNSIRLKTFLKSPEKKLECILIST